MELVRKIVVGMLTLIRVEIFVTDGAVYSIVENLKNTYCEKYFNIDYFWKEALIYIIKYLQNKTVID